MLCESCGKEKAVIHVNLVVDGKKTTQLLCAGCHADQSDSIDPELIAKDMTEVAKTLFEPLVPAMMNLKEQLESARADEVSVEVGPCRHCGMTWAEFRKNSRFGCARCYDAFNEQLAALFARVQGSDRHAGRVPKRALARLTRSRRLGELRGELETAVKAEDYEAAARLRDQIRRLEAEEDSPLGAR